MDNLSILLKPLRYEIDGIWHEAQIVEFLVNGSELSEILGIERGLENCGCDIDPVTKTILPDIYNRFIEVLAGEIAPVNQFGTPRVVLYRCHCGCDYCGVVSCAISRSGQSITWSSIGYELDNPPKDGPTYTFDLSAYMEVINQFSGKYT